MHSEIRAVRWIRIITIINTVIISVIVVCYKVDIYRLPQYGKHNFHTNTDDYKDEARCFTEHLDRLHKAVHVYIYIYIYIRMHTLAQQYEVDGL